MSNCPGRFALLRFVADDLALTRRTEIEDHLGSCPQCSALMQEIKQHTSQYEGQRELQQAKLRKAMATAENDTPTATASTRLRSIAFATAALVIIGLGTWLYAAWLESAPNNSTAAIRYKGALSVTTVVKRGETQFVFRDGDTLHAGDALRFTVTTPHKGYLLLLYRDAANAGSIVYPAPDTALTHHPIDAPGDHLLPGSIELDDSSGTEYFYVAFSKTAFSPPDDINHIDSWLEEQPASVTIHTMELYKE